jgi:hypothetical protein
MTKMQDIDYPVGFSIFQLDAGGTYMITGNISKEYRFRDFSSAYDLQEYIEKHIDCSDIDFDSEYCQFWAYSKTLDRAKQFVDDITAWVTKVKELVN